jgi:hypothetical protein
MNDDVLDLYILDAGGNEFAIVLARAGTDLALGRIPFGEELASLLRFRERINEAAHGLGGLTLLCQTSEALDSKVVSS